MTKYPVFQLAEIVGCSESLPPEQKYWIMQTLWTCDGPRTRITNYKYSKKEDAVEALCLLNDGRLPPAIV